MKTLTATFRIVTPMFIAGADQKNAELRVPSIKGALRFWWRALQWQKVQDVTTLRKTEAELFGSSESGQSKILLSIHDSSTEQSLPPEWKMKDHSDRWKCYSGFGVHEGIRPCLNPGGKFILRLALREKEEFPKEVRSALKIFGLLGGLGSRSRNGWGSLTLTSLEEWEGPESPEALKREIAGLIGSKEREAPYSAFTSGTEFAVGPEKASAQAAHRWLVEKYLSVKETPGITKEDRVELGLPRSIKRTQFRQQSELACESRFSSCASDRSRQRYSCCGVDSIRTLASKGAASGKTGCCPASHHRINSIQTMTLADQLRRFAIRHPEVKRLELCGSASYGDASTAKDVDLVVTFAPGSNVTLPQFCGLKEELENEIGNPVDLSTRRSVERSSNPFRRERILKEATTFYER